jgi:hypothetical protein
MVVEYKNVKVGNILASLFKLPAVLEVMEFQM